MSQEQHFIYVLKIFFFKCVFISEREGETEHEQGRSREIGRQSRKQAVSTEPNAGLELTSREIMTRTEGGYLTD